MNFNFFTLAPTVQNILNDFERERPHDPINFKHRLMLIFLCTGAIVFILLFITAIIDYFNQLDFEFGGFMELSQG